MKKALLGVLLLGSAALACSESREAPLSPDRTVNQAVPITTSSSSVKVLQRLAPLDADISMTARIGRYGGAIEIPAAGIKVIFPQGAVTRPTAITVTAHQGSNVAYTFRPHGLNFKVPVRVQQEAKVTEAWRNTALTGSQGAYFVDHALSGDLAKVTEFRPTSYDLNGSKFHWSIEHFSGYLLSVP